MFNYLQSTALLFFCLVSVVGSATERYEFRDDNDRVRYLTFIDEMRCPKCQNQNLADSNSPIANDLRRELRRLLNEGKSDTEITEFMVSRYGDYVLYKPKLQANTVALWFGPVLFFTIGLFVLALILRRKTRATRNDNMTEEQQKRLHTLLENDDQQQ